MKTTDLVAVPYRVARVPLSIVDFKLVQRLPDDSRTRMVFERTLGTVDQIAGRLLRDDSLAQIGGDRIDAASKLARAAELDEVAATERRAASEQSTESEREADAKREEAQKRQAAGLAEAAETERKGKQEAAAKARAQATKAKQHASARANQSLSTIQRELERTEAVAEAREHRAETAAKATFDDASQEKASARVKRAQADQLT